jgi:nicotinamidase-related amidase
MPRTALLVVDMLNTYDHEDGDALLESVREVVPVIADLIAQVRDGDDDDNLLVYVNDNHEDWTSGRGGLTDWALKGRDPSVIEPIAPPDDVPFLVKARHSAFYATQLEYLLRSQGVERVVVAGQVTEQCILYTALDAYIRHFDIVVPRDAVAHIDRELADAALRLMETNMRAEIVEAREVFARA